MVIEYLAELEDNGICFIEIASNTSDCEISMFFQGEKDDPFPALESDCESGALKVTLEKLFRSLLKIPDSSPPLVKDVTTGNHSKTHHLTIQHEHTNSGKLLALLLLR